MDLLWPELVLHVLAHLESTAELPSTLYDPTYVQTVHEQIGPIRARALDGDVALLSTYLATHAELSQVQLLTRLHPSFAAARHEARLPLSKLSSTDHSDPAVRDALLRHCPVAAELLRCAALLESEHFSSWPLPDRMRVQEQFGALLPRFWSVAPQLRHLPVYPLRVLGLRGRAWPDQIWVGFPREDGEPSVMDVLWQAAHEATVIEVGQRAVTETQPLSERGIEQCAVALLARRVARANHTVGYARWLGRMTREVVGWSNSDSLSREHRAWLDGFTLDPL